jgi:hypothetical protein
VRVCTASRYRLAGMHPTSRSPRHAPSRLRRTEQRASNLPPRGLNTAPTVRRSKPHTCNVHEVLTGGMVYAAWHVHVTLSPPVLAVLAGMAAVVLKGKR